MAGLGLGFSSPASFTLTSRQPLSLPLLEHFRFPCPPLLLSFLPSQPSSALVVTESSPQNYKIRLLLIPFTPFPSPDVF